MLYLFLEVKTMIRIFYHLVVFTVATGGATALSHLTSFIASYEGSEVEILMMASIFWVILMIIGSITAEERLEKQTALGGRNS